ncbi:twin-arginine translocase subunit TatC [Mobiluncus mulieris]|uniref:twin-arginine translocase subunit TatC n=1 Tax=Mobiluncus mulieris TaxID=2052 RepID=UPI003119A4F6
MTIAAHLKELRRRLIFALLGIAAASIGGWFLYELALAHITAPMRDIGGAELNFQTIGAALDLKLRVTLWLGILMSSPWWIYQTLAFLWPGLKNRERSWLAVFGFFGVVLFAGGAVFGDWTAPRAVQILASFTPPEAVMLLSADSYIHFYIRLVIAFGLSFLIPEILVMLNFVGVLRARQMLKAWRLAVMVALVFSAIANPLPTPWPILLQAGALLTLYFGAVGISALHDCLRGRRRKLGSCGSARE